MQYDKQPCPYCGELIGINNIKRHIKKCDGTLTSSIKQRNKKDSEIYVVTHEGLNCIFCDKLCKNLNSLTQHELRCPHNPNRRSYNNLGKYSTEHKKGQTKYTSAEIMKQTQSLLKLYNSGYVSPIKGRTVAFDYLYEEYNNCLISKWISYVENLNIQLPKYEVYIVKGCYNKGKGCYKNISTPSKLVGYPLTVLFEHDYIANLLLGGTLQPNNTVHHIDRNGINNAFTNLMVFATKNDHKRFHNSKYAKLIYDEETHLFSCYLDKSQ